MSLGTDIRTDLRAVSESAIDQLADRFDDLPRPMLAAIGAGDLALEQLAALRESLLHQVADLSQPGARPFTPSQTQQTAADYAGKIARAATEYVGKAQGVVADLPDKAQQVATASVGKAQQVVVELPGRTTDLPHLAQTVATELAESILTKIAQFSGDVTAETVRDTLDAYVELVGTIYGSLADRGDRTWSRIRSSTLRPGTVVDALTDAPKRAAKVASMAGATAKAGAATTRKATAKVTTAAPKTAHAAKAAGKKDATKDATKRDHAVDSAPTAEAAPARKPARKPAGKPARKPTTTTTTRRTPSAGTTSTDAD